MDDNNETDQAPSFTNFPDLASEVVGGAIIYATDDWFAAAENMLKDEAPVFKDDLFTEYGKWMDGWETRRKRIDGHDWCIIQLGCPGKVHGIEVSTRFFTGNYPPQFSIQGAALPSKLKPRSGDRMGTHAPEEETENIEKINSENWKTLVPKTNIKPGYRDSHQMFFNVEDSSRITHIRLNIYPDGGIARLRVYGEVKPDWSQVSEKEEIDLVAMTNGGVCVAYTDAHYGHARNVIAPGRAKKMSEGWETARRQDRPAFVNAEQLHNHGGECAIYRLGHPGHVDKVEIDTKHFKGNFPHSFEIQGVFLDGLGEEVAHADQLEATDWTDIVPKHKLQSHHQHFIEGDKIKDAGKVNYVRLTIYPDGGISRMLLFGHIIKG